MGICTDKSVNYLKSLNLNVILHPSADIKPLDLLGEYKDARGIIGTLDQLVDPQAAALPPISQGVAANINGQKSSKLPIELGLGILGNIIGALGGKLDLSLAYEKAVKIEFSFMDVTRHRANTIGIGDYLAKSKVRWDHLILEKYLFDSGKLFVLTEVVTARKIGVTAYREDKTKIALDVPVIQEIAGGSLKVGSENNVTTTVVYEGTQDVAFGFAAIELSAGDRGDDGELDLVFRPVKAGTVSFSIGGHALVAADFEGALRRLERIDPAALGQG